MSGTNRAVLSDVQKGNESESALVSALSNANEKQAKKSTGKKAKK